MDSDAAFQIRTAGQVGPTGRPLPDFPEPEPLASHGPARIIAMCNQKGGVGKTTTTINLGAALAEVGRQVLLVDFDPQGALSVGLGVPVNELDVTIYNLLIERGHDIRDVIEHTRSTASTSCRPTSTCRPPRCSSSARSPASRSWPACCARSLDDYDVILIDCQPSLGLLTVNALTAAHGVIIPLECEFFAMRGVALLIETIEKITDRLNPRLKVDGILATMYDSRTLHRREVVRSRRRALRRPGLPHGHQPHREVPRRDPGRRADHDLRRHPPGANAYRQLARELIARGDAA